METGRKVNLYLNDDRYVQVRIIDDNLIEMALCENRSRELAVNRVTVSGGITLDEFLGCIEGLINSGRKR